MKFDMAPIELGLRCPQNVNGIAADPQPDWSFDNLLSELDSIDKQLNLKEAFPSTFTKTQPRDVRASSENRSRGRAFVMHVSDDENSCIDTDSDSDDDTDKPLVSGRRFACDELYMSDDSEDDLSLGMQCDLMDKVGSTEVAVVELTHELQLSLSEEVRSKISVLETELVNENERFASLTNKIDMYRKSQQERERKIDLQYRRTIAEALDNHLTAVQRDHEHISQLEERRIKDDAAREEAKRKEKAIQEEKLRQERIKAEEEARLKFEMAERAKVAAVEAEKKVAEEAASKRASESLNTAHKAVEDNSAVGVSSSSVDARNTVKASENALELEKRRQKIYEELSAESKVQKESSKQDYRRHGQNFFRQIKTVTASIENVITKAEELVELINSSGCPRSISILLFSEKIVSNSTNQRSSDVIFAISRVIVLVTSKIPVAMDILIAELNRVCIYTVPKHISYSEEAFRTKDAYFKAIGFREENGKIESIDDYVERLSCYMKLYGALVQTEVDGIKNLHGITEAWAWLARFLNALPANLYTAVALDSFLEMAGYALYRRYRNQFEKLLRIIGCDFLCALKEGGSESRSAKLSRVKTSIRSYIESKQFMKQPEGWQLREHLESSIFF